MSSYEDSTYEDFLSAIQTKDFVCLKNILQSHEHSFDPISTLSCHAAIGGHLDVLQWTVKNGFNLDRFAWFYAIQNGQLHVLEWLKQFASQFMFNIDQTCSDAINSKQWDVLDWARKNNYGWGEYSCCLAALDGELDILKRARSEGAYWDERTCIYAAQKGHIHVLEWLRSQDFPDGSDPYHRPCPWNNGVCRAAASHGHLEVLKWAVANGCPWHPYAFSDAGSNRHMHIVQWILYMKLPWEVETMHTMAETFASCNSYDGYNDYRWRNKYSNKTRWANAIDVNLMECLHCADLEQLIKNYI